MLELTSLACLRDPEYAEYFASLAHDLSSVFRPKRNVKANPDDRTLPLGLSIKTEDIIKSILIGRLPPGWLEAAGRSQGRSSRKSQREEGRRLGQGDQAGCH